MRIVEITKELWNKYKNEHKRDQVLTNGVIELNRQSMEELFYTMRVAEKLKSHNILNLRSWELLTQMQS